MNIVYYYVSRVERISFLGKIDINNRIKRKGKKIRNDRIR